VACGVRNLMEDMPPELCAQAEGCVVVLGSPSRQLHCPPQTSNETQATSANSVLQSSGLQSVPVHEFPSSTFGKQGLGPANTHQIWIRKCSYLKATARVLRSAIRWSWQGSTLSHPTVDKLHAWTPRRLPAGSNRSRRLLELWKKAHHFWLAR